MFRKLVSYLANSPSALWGLSNLSSKIKRETIKNNWSIGLAVLSLIIIIVSSLVSSPTNMASPPLSTKIQPRISASIKLLNSNDNPQIQPSKLYEFEISITNTSSGVIRESFELDLSGVNPYLTVLPNKDIIVKNTTVSLEGLVLGPQENKTVALQAQSLNRFEPLANQDCTARISFGNDLAIPTVCPRFKKIELLLKKHNNISLLSSLIIAIVVIITTKLYRQLENYITLAEIKALRDYINRGGSL